MYFPYLRGRQFELIALREFALQKGGINHVFPIIEPVKKTFNSLKIAFNIFKENDLPFALIMNPHVGDLQGNKQIYDNLRAELKETNWIPALLVNDNIEVLQEYIDEKGFEHVMLILENSANPDNANFEPFVTNGKVKYIVSTENRTLKRRLRNAKKDFVLLSDNFKKLERNKDYLSAKEEKFSEENIFFKEDGYVGFSDFTIIPSDFSEGGTTPYAVVIHLTYQKATEEIWIRHFTSVSNEDQANVQKKFAEATEKAVAFLDAENTKTHAANELREYFQAEKYPGLGMVKKISIKHHLELINSIL